MDELKYQPRKKISDDPELQVMYNSRELAIKTGSNRKEIDKKIASYKASKYDKRKREKRKEFFKIIF